MAKQGVGESKSGNITEKEELAPAASEKEVKTPEDVSKLSPGEEPIYSQTQANLLLHAAQSEWGRQRTALEKDRDTYKSQAEKQQSDLADNAKDIEALQTKLDDMSSDDPQKFDVAKELKAAREERKQLKADRVALEDEKRTLEPYKQEKRTRDIFDIAQEYEVDNYDKLYDLCDVTGANSEEQIRKIADTLWLKRGAEEEATKEKKPKAPKPFSGKSDGGSPYFTRTQIG